MNEKSCLGCKFLYTRDYGYSNYTVLDTNVECAIDANPNLPDQEPWNIAWNHSVQDQWAPTMNSRCGFYQPGPMVQIDVEGENKPEDFTTDKDVIEAIRKKEDLQYLRDSDFSENSIFRAVK